MSEKTVRLNVEIPKELHKALKQHAFEADTSVASIVRSLIIQYVAKSQNDLPATAHSDSALLNRIRKLLAQPSK